MTIDSDHGRRVFVLQVAGLRYRYMSHDIDLSGSNLDANITTGIVYEDKTGLVSIGALSGSIDPAGGVASYQGVSVTLASRGARGDASDPHVVFGRCGARSEVTRAKLTQLIAYDDDPTLLIRVDRDLRGQFTTPALVHVGAETFRVSSITATSLVSGARAVGGSQRQAHLISMGGTNVPEVTTEITTFRGRRAVLFAAHRYPDGGLSDFVEVINGFIDNSPQVEDAGEVSFSLLPFAALASTASAAIGVQSYLRQGYHYFGTVANRFEWAWRLAGPNERITVQSVSISAPNKTLSISTTPELAALFDATLPKASDGYERSHPRFPALYINGTQAFIEPHTVTATYVIYNTTDQPSVVAGDILRLSPTVEIKRVGFEEELVEWPTALAAALGSAQSSNSVTGDDGSWGRVQIAESELVLTPNAAFTPYSLELLTWSKRSVLLNSHPDARYWALVPSDALRDVERLRYPVQLGEEALADPGRPGSSQFLYRNPVQQNGRASSSRVMLGGVALAWYQLREPLILCENTIGLPTAPDGREYDVEVKYFDRVSGEARRQWFTATHESQATLDAQLIGTYVHLKAGSSVLDNVSFGDWQGQERAVLFRSSKYSSLRPGQLLLRILESGGGGEINGPYDLYPVGLGIPDSEIDVASFLAYDSTAAFNLTGVISGDDADLRGIIEGVLKLMGCAIIMHRSPTTGRSLVTLQPLGAENARLVDQEIGEADWHADPPPRWSTYEDIVTQVSYRFAWNEEEGKYLAERTFVNQEAVARYGGEMKKIDIEVRGLTIEDVGDGAGDSFGFFLPTSARLFNLLSNPAREWVGSIGTGPSMLLDVGSYVRVTSKHLKGYADSYGVSEQIGFVRGMTQDLMGEGCQLEMIALGLEPVTWNATGLVTTINSTTSVTLASAQFSDDDASFFKAGDVVDYLPLANEDGALTGLVIATVVGQLVTFTSVHSISTTGGTLEPTSYSSASTSHKADAYLASNDALPVLGSDRAQDYA